MGHSCFLQVDSDDDVHVSSSCERILLKKSKDDKNRMRLSGSSYFTGGTGGRTKDDNGTCTYRPFI